MKAFGEIANHDFFQSLSEGMEKEIQKLDKDYVLKVDENEYKQYLVQRYSLEPVAIDFNAETFEEPKKSKKKVKDDFRERYYEVDVYTFHIEYPFTGSESIFRMRPSSWIMTGGDIFINSSKRTVGFSFDMWQLNPEKFNQEKNQLRVRAFANLENANKDVNNWNRDLPNKVNVYFDKEKKKYLGENAFFEQIKLKSSKSSSNVFSAPTLVKKTVTQPKVTKNKEFASEPSMAMEIYKEIISIIYSAGKNMEKKPSLYIAKDEEALRDQFIFVLENKYDSTTATGETFNRSGKTDITLKYAVDGTNLFIAECKFWHGASEFHKAIGQIFERYLTWRDSKVAILLFVTNSKFTSVIDVIKEEVPKNKYYVKDNGASGETSLSYIFSLPQDEDRQVFLEIMAFHFDKKS